MVLPKKTIVFFSLLAVSVLGLNDADPQMVTPVMAYQSKLVLGKGDQQRRLEQQQKVLQAGMKKVKEWQKRLERDLPEDVDKQQKVQQQKFWAYFNTLKLQNKEKHFFSSQQDKDEIEQLYEEAKEEALKQLEQETRRYRNQNEPAKQEQIEQEIQRIKDADKQLNDDDQGRSQAGDDDDDDTGGFKCWYIVLIVQGVVCLLVGVGVLICCLMSGRSNENQQQPREYAQDFDEENESEEGLDEESCY